MSTELTSQELIIAYFVVTYVIALVLWVKLRDQWADEGGVEHVEFVWHRILALLLAPILLPLFLLVALFLYPPVLAESLIKKFTERRRLKNLENKYLLAEKTILSLTEVSSHFDESAIVEAIQTLEKAQLHFPLASKEITIENFSLIDQGGRATVDKENCYWELQRSLGINCGHGIPPLYLRLEGGPSKKDWVAVFTSPFKKAIQKQDKKLQGRVLDAIIEILEAPTDVRGDTVKPLSKNLAPKWRYRIGDFRLVYVPLVDSSKVIFVDFDARGGVYE
jgi:mRNA-degrading endonuclease RelE of RelBE toxin-antitoxin system